MATRTERGAAPECAERYGVMAALAGQEATVVKVVDGGAECVGTGVLDWSGHHERCAFLEEIFAVEEVVLRDEARGDTDAVFAEDFLEGGEKDGACGLDTCHVEGSQRLSFARSRDVCVGDDATKFLAAFGEYGGVGVDVVDEPEGGGRCVSKDTEGATAFEACDVFEGDVVVDAVVDAGFDKV